MIIKFLLTAFLCLLVYIITVNINKIPKAYLSTASNRSLKLSISLSFLLIIPTYFINYNFTDEAYYHTLLIFERKIVSFSSISIYLHEIGELFSHELLAYRGLSFVVIYSTTYIVYLEFVKFLQMCNAEKKKLFVLFALLASFYPIYGLITISYNTIVIAGVFLISASVISLFNNNKIKYILYNCLGLIFVFFGRPPAAILLIGVSLITFFCYERKFFKLQLVACVVFVCFLMMLISLEFEYYLEILNYYKYLSKSSHSSLILNYLHAFVTDFIYTTPLILFLFIIYNKYGSPITNSNKHHYLFIYLILTLSIFFLLLILDMGVVSFKYVIYSVISLNSVIFFKEKDLSNKQKILIILSTLLPLSANFSTNGNLVHHSGAMLLVYFIPVISIITNEIHKNSHYLILQRIISLFLILQTFNVFYLNPYMSDPIFGNKKMWYETPLTFSLIDYEIAEKGLSVKSSLEEMDFIFGKDRIFAYPNAPGYSSILKIEPYGNSWNFGGYKQIDLANCYHLNNENMTDGNVFLILEEELSEEIKSCLYNNLTINDQTTEKQIYFQNKKIKILGPLFQKRKKYN